MPEIDLGPIREELNAASTVPMIQAYARLSLVASREVEKFRNVYFAKGDPEENEDDLAVATNGYMIATLATDTDFTGYLPADPFIAENYEDTAVDWLNPADLDIGDERAVNPFDPDASVIDIDDKVTVENGDDTRTFDLPDPEPTQYGNSFQPRGNRNPKSFMVNTRLLHRMMMALAPGSSDVSGVASINFDTGSSEKSPMKIHARNGLGVFMPLSTDKGKEVIEGDEGDEDGD